MIIQRALNDLADWKDFLRSENIIVDLVNPILKQCNISAYNIKKINIGTNGIFDLGNYILKVYAVNEKSNSKLDCDREIILSNLLMSSPYCVPTVIKTGYIDDRYAIYYNVMEKFNDLVPVCHILSQTKALDYTVFLEELHSIINCISSLQVDSKLSVYTQNQLWENHQSVMNMYNM